jgi:hypothetical protein
VPMCTKSPLTTTGLYNSVLNLSPRINCRQKVAGEYVVQYYSVRRARARIWPVAWARKFHQSAITHNTYNRATVGSQLETWDEKTRVVRWSVENEWPSTCSTACTADLMTSVNFRRSICKYAVQCIVCE